MPLTTLSDELPIKLKVCLYVLAMGKQKTCAQWLLYVRIHAYIHVRPITPPPERPRLQLQPRSKPLEDTSGGRERGGGGGRGGGGRASSSIFGQAKPVDTAARDREIEERLLKVSSFPW